jgi:hypothetical protein
MRTPSGWALPGQKSLQVLCACLALWIVPAPAAATSTASHNTLQIGNVSFDRRVLTLVAMVCLIGTIAGWTGKGARAPRIRLFTKPKKTQLTVLVPPGPAPRLVPGDSPNATRPRPAPAPVPRVAPPGTGSGIIDYIAPFAGSGEAGEKARVDYLLESEESGESLDPP